jgi:hypothetical protein
MRGLVMGVVAVLCLAGCSSSVHDSPGDSPTAKATIAVDDAYAMKEGRDYDVVATLPARIHGDRTRYFGVSPDGLVFGETYAEDPKAEPPVGPGDMGFSTRSNVILLDPASGKVTQVSDGNARAHRAGVSGIDVNDEWVTWLEIDAMEGSGWTLYSYDRSTGTERKLGTHRDADWQDNSVGPEGRPAIMGDRVVMSTIAFGDEMRKRDQVLSVPLDGSAPLTELVGGATAVEVDADGISYVTSTGALTFRDRNSGETKILDNEKASRCQHHRSGLVMTCESSAGEWWINLKTKDGQKALFGPFEEWIGDVQLQPDWARFVIDADGPPTFYAIDTDRLKLFKVAAPKTDWQLMGNHMALISPFEGTKGDITLIQLR